MIEHDTSKLHECGKLGSFRITLHAVERYMERAKQTRPKRAITRIVGLMADSIPCDNQRNWRYSRGWMLAVVGDQIITVMRPTKRCAMEAIYAACNNPGPDGDR